jgi:hypothetical protein
MAANNSFDSAANLFRLVMVVKEGTAKAVRTPKTVIVTISSISVKPRYLRVIPALRFIS